MRFRVGVAAFGAVVLAGGPVAPVVKGALAQQTGASGFSGTLASNRMLRRHQLNVDPPPPEAGNISVLYDPAKVRLVNFIFGPGYNVQTDFLGYIEVRVNGVDQLWTIESFLNSSVNPKPTETGYVQANFASFDPVMTGRIGLSNGYTERARDPGVTGVDGVDTHALFFELLPELPIETSTQYTIFAAAAGQYGTPGTGDIPGGVNEADFLRIRDAMNRPVDIPAGSLAPAQVAADFDVPEPGGACALAAAGAAGLLRRRVRGRQ